MNNNPLQDKTRQDKTRQDKTRQDKTNNCVSNIDVCVKNDTSALFTLPKLLKAYYACRKNKRNTMNALKFELTVEENLLRLVRQLQNRSYQPGRSVCFIVVHPKNREIFAADFADRIIHHLLIGEVESYFDKSFIHTSFACRKGKGTHKARQLLFRGLSQITHNRTRPAFFAQLDVASFFTSISKDTLYQLVEKKVQKLNEHPIWKEEVLYLAKVIIFHDPTSNYYKKGDKSLFATVPLQKSLFGVPEDKGLPIGNLSSQFFANVYLDTVDQFAKKKLGIKHYFRYVDDFILLGESKKQLETWRDEIARFLARELQLRLHPNKQIFGSVYSGLDFIGYFIKPDYVLCRKRVVREFRRKLFIARSNLKESPTLEEITNISQMINSYYGHFRHGNCYNLRKRMYEKHFGILQKYLMPQHDLRFFRPMQPS